VLLSRKSRCVAFLSFLTPFCDFLTLERASFNLESCRRTAMARCVMLRAVCWLVGLTHRLLMTSATLYRATSVQAKRQAAEAELEAADRQVRCL
jgi:hypothetical protein